MANKYYSPTIDTQLRNIEKDILTLKEFFFLIFPLKRIFPESDEKVWQKVKKDYEKTQERLFKENYPSLYAKIKK